MELYLDLYSLMFFTIIAFGVMGMIYSGISDKDTETDSDSQFNSD